MSSVRAQAKPVGPDHRESEAVWRERSGELFARFQRPARAMVRRAFRGAFSDEELDDIYAGAWVGVLRALSTRHAQLSDDEISSYVLTAVAHQAGKELRRRRRKPTAPLDLVGGVPDMSDGPDEQVADAERSQITRDLLTTLPPRRRAVILLRYGWGLEPRQVCSLVKGLSPRAYRKEITRGVDELTEKMRTFERGDWCADREPILKVYAAGLADADQSRQAKAHISHCHECRSFVARLSGHLCDLGTVVVPLALHGTGASMGIGERMAELGSHAREAVTRASTHPAVEDASARVASTAGGKGAGVAGAGLVANLAGAGAAGKLALACVGGGLAATACIAAGVGPLSSSGFSDSKQTERPAVKQAKRSSGDVVATPAPIQPVAVTDSALLPSGEVDTVPSRRNAEAAESAASDEPVEAATPPTDQEFGVEAAAVSASTPPLSSGSTATSSAAGSPSEAQQEFGGP